MADLTNTLLANTKQYSDTLYHLASQKNSKLEETVSKEIMSVKKDFFDRIGNVEFTPVISQYQNTPHQEIKYSRRALECSDSVFATLIDKRDTARSIINPQSDIIQRALRAYNLQKDKVIIAAALGNAEAIGENDSSSQIALPNSQIITESGNLTTAKIKKGIEKFFANDVDLSENKVCLAISPSMYNALLNQAEFINKDFRLTDGQTIDTSGVSEVLGVNVKIVSNKALLPLNASNIRSAVMYTYGSIKLGMQAGIEEVSIDKRPDKLNATQIMHTISLGGVRMEEEQVVAIQCDESA